MIHLISEYLETEGRGKKTMTPYLGEQLNLNLNHTVTS